MPTQKTSLHFKNFVKLLPLLGISLLFVSSKEKRPADEGGLVVPEGFTIERIVSPDLLSYPMFGVFDGTGRMFVFESTEPNTMSNEEMLKNPSYHVRLLEDTDHDGIYDKSKIFADKLPFPKGGTFYNGSLYITASPDLIKLTDTDNDGTADHREVVLTGWTLHHNGATLGGPFFGPDGWLYLTDAHRGFEIKSKEGITYKGKGARIWRCRPDGTGLEWISGGGFDNSVEIAFMPSGETIGTMTYFIDPQDGLRDALMHWVEGGIYPKPHVSNAEDGLKLTGDLMPVMTKLPRVAPSGLMRYRGSAIGSEFRGNLFSAQFNTGRIMRHIVTPNGASYETVDEPFMTSTASDSHPTDVFQDADGSLLVVITGGWFIEGCPLSRVAKPDVRGGIYRIRKKGAPVVKDAWGHQLKLQSATSQQLITYLSDARPVVRDNAMEQLIRRGKTSVPYLRTVLLQSKDEEIRAAAVFALYRINTPASFDAMRIALSDKSGLVRTAAARTAGLARDRASADKLMQLVLKDSAPVRRQAATALGQIGDKRAMTALINASANPDDRFVEHALIHSMMTLNSPQPLLNALKNPSDRIKKAAIIALDQMDESPLKKENLVPFLSSTNAELRKAGIWIAAHHPDWSDVAVSFIKERLQKNNLSANESASLRELMLTFIKDAGLQDVIAAQLSDKTAPVSRRLFVVDVISGSSLSKLPSSWITPLGTLLTPDSDPQILQEVLNLTESRRIKALTEPVEKMIQNPSLSAGFRLKAFGARIMTNPELSKNEFEILTHYLENSFDSPTRQFAVRLLGQAKLTDEQLLTLADNYVPKADPFLLPSLINAFEKNSNPKVGASLVSGLQLAKDRLDNISEQDIERVLKSFPTSVQESSGSILAVLRKKNAERLAKLEKMEKDLKGGDVMEGRKLFFGKASCYGCHAVGKEGGNFGPDLTNIGEIRSSHDILEAIVYPNVSFAREHETFRITTKTATFTGIIKEQLPEAIVVALGPAPGIRIPRTEITSIEPHNVSMMPSGLDEQLTKKEMANLMAFLKALPYRLDRIIKEKEKGSN